MQQKFSADGLTTDTKVVHNLTYKKTVTYKYFASKRHWSAAEVEGAETEPELNEEIKDDRTKEDKQQQEAQDQLKADKKPSAPSSGGGKDDPAGMKERSEREAQEGAGDVMGGRDGADGGDKEKETRIVS